MTDQTLKLGGKQWTLPALSWLACEQIEPVLFDLGAALEQASGQFTRLDRVIVGRLAEAAFLAARQVEPGLDRAAFDALPFGRRALIENVETLARACGLDVKAHSEGDPPGEL
jgi:hypothetical protein